MPRRGNIKVRTGCQTCRQVNVIEEAMLKLIDFYAEKGRLSVMKESQTVFGVGDPAWRVKDIQTGVQNE